MCDFIDVWPYVGHQDAGSRRRALRHLLGTPARSERSVCLRYRL